MNIRNISCADMPTCVTNVGQSGSDHTGTDGLNWFSVSLCGLSMLRQAIYNTMLSIMPFWGYSVTAETPPETRLQLLVAVTEQPQSPSSNCDCLVLSLYKLIELHCITAEPIALLLSLLHCHRAFQT